MMTIDREEFRQALAALRAQNRTLIGEARQRQEILDEIRLATERTARCCSWIALPVYLAVLSFMASIIIQMVRSL